jgi:hypothetical protein
MPLRVRITNKVVNTDNTLGVDYTLAWADTAGIEVWSETHTDRFAPGTTRLQVLEAIRQKVEAKALAIEAAVALDEDIGKTYERMPDGTWVILP